MHTGANLLLNVMDVLTWIRHHRYIFATDITKMYRQIQVHKDDWNLQRILWIDNQLNEVPFHFTTVTYGTKVAPFLATRVLLQLVEDEGRSFPLAVPSFTHGRYVDDIFGGADTIEQITAVAHDVIGLCKAGNFPLSKWYATDSQLLSNISVKGELTSAMLADGGRNIAITSSPTATVSLDDCETKLLGLKWIPHEDKFIFSSKFGAPQEKLTKRLVLSEVAQIFDPLGFVSPVVIKAKVLLQELWLLKLGWDDPLPASICTRWLSIRSQLNSLASVSVPRWLNTWSDSTVELHGFLDASQLAMGAVIYLTVKLPSTGSCSTLVYSKTKVAPLKRLTIPRLELTAALMLAKLAAHIKATLKLKVNATHMCTDSQVTLIWIRSFASRWKDYVRNRVTRIQELCTDTTWRHVPGSMNPADCASRGVTTEQLKDHPVDRATMAHKGSKIMADSTGNIVITRKCRSSSWSDINCYDSGNHVSLGLNIQILIVNQAIKDHHYVHEIHSQAQTIARVASSSHLDSGIGESSTLLDKGNSSSIFHSRIKDAQKGISISHHSCISRLTAFIDNNGIIRVGGRLEETLLNYEEKHPAVLPRHSYLSALIIDHAYKLTLYGGTQLTLAKIRQTCWILGGRSPVKSHILRRVVCAR